MQLTVFNVSAGHWEDVKIDPTEIKRINPESRGLTSATLTPSASKRLGIGRYVTVAEPCPELEARLTLCLSRYDMN